MVILQHIQHAGSRGSSDSEDWSAGIRVERRDRRGVYLVHRTDPRVPGRQAVQLDPR